MKAHGTATLLAHPALQHGSLDNVQTAALY
jgi:hypothetical protein